MLLQLIKYPLNGLIAGTLALIFLFPVPLSAESKSGVEPQVISLPSGPGSIEGLGESFEPHLNTGTATYGVKISVPPGINNHQPEIVLEYNGGYGNSPFGLGWNLNFEFIQRQTDKGVPEYVDEDVFVYSGSNELVPLPDGIYRLKIEGLFMKFQKKGDTWEVWRKNGTHLYFGTTANSRQINSKGTFKWLIDREVDTNGNEIHYFYETDNGQVYLSEIRYSIMAKDLYKSVRLLYETRPDIYTDYRSRSRILTDKRLSEIHIMSQETLVRKYLISYSDDADFSLLSQVAQIGADGLSALPPVSFEYTRYSPESIETIAMVNPPPAGISISNSNVELVDIDGDSLTDIVHTSPIDGIHYFYLNQGHGKWAARAEVPDASPPYLLATQGIMMSDMNGDGLADLFVRTTDAFGYFKNAGKTTWEETDWQACRPVPNFSFESQNVRMLDVNNDKLIDVMVDGGSSYYIWLNHADNQWNTAFDFETNLPDGNHLSFSSSSTRMGDMNGDRIQDLVFIIDGYVSYFPGKGNGEFDSEVVMANPPYGSGGAANLLAVSDINNDGLGDIVQIGNEAVRVWFNQGNQTFKAPVLFEGTPSYMAGTSAFRFADMNGDGFTDLLMIDSTSPTPCQYVDFNNGIYPNLLTKISNGLGREITIDYTSSTEFYLSDRDNGLPWQTKLPFPVQVVSRVTVKDKNSGAEYITDYHYRDGYYDGREKEFRGFGGLDKMVYGDSTGPTLKTRYTFDTGKEEESRKGLVTSLAALTEEGTLNPPAGIFDITASDIVTRDLHTGENGERVRFSYISENDTWIYENSLDPVQIRKETTQDDFGNTIASSDYGIVEDGDYAKGDDEVRSFTSFLIDQENWMMDRPLEIRMEDLSGNFISHQKNNYDAKGNLIIRQDAVSEGNFITTLQNRYDIYGNIIRITDANSHWRQITYDPLFHAFPVSEQIGGTPLTMTAGYDTARGLLTSFSDFNGHITRFEYDTYSRIINIIKPGDTPDFPTQSFAYHLSDPVSSVLVQSRETSGTHQTYDTISYYDGLGRKLMTKSEGPENNWVVSEAVRFNAKGEVQKNWLPYFSTGLDYEIPNPAFSHTTFAYDAKGRSIKETNPDATLKSTAYLPLQTTVYDEEDNGTGPHADTPHSFFYDGLERLVKVREKNNDQIYTTTYAYDGQNNLTKIIDNEGNIKTMQYDGLGRKTYMNDPDKHEMHYAYDPAGNLVRTTDAKAQTVTYTHDPANRVLTENFNGTKVRYHYDDDLSPTFPDLSNTLGKLAWVEDEAGTEYYSYDARGNLVTKIREAAGYTFVNKTAYDAMDRVVAMTYPDGFTLTYQYNAMNQLDSIPGFVSGIDYIATGQKSGFTYANGIQSDYTYDARQRMQQLQTRCYGKVLQDFTYRYDAVSNILAIADGRPEKTTDNQTRSYAYDNLYRLTSAIAPAWTETYQYSSIGNMTFKSDLGIMTYGENGAGPHAVTAAPEAGITYTYDANGNISSKTPGYTYRFDHKDRMTGATRLADNADISYTYDFQGNRVSKNITIGADTATTVYADKFTELRQNSLVKQVFAADRLVARIFTPFHAGVMETRLTPLTIDDFDNNPADGVITLAEIRTQGKDSNTMEVPDVADALRIYQNNLETSPNIITFETMSKAFHELGGMGPGEETVRFYLPDHLGSASIVTDAHGNMVEESVFYPYGANRARTGSFESEYRFTGKELDDETGLHYFGARYYDSQVGRFVSVDPLYVEGNFNNKHALEFLNLYAYAEDSPITYQDFDGLFKINIGSARIDLTTSVGKVGEGALNKISPGSGPLFKSLTGTAKAAEAAIQGKPMKAVYEMFKVKAELANFALDKVDDVVDVFEAGYDELIDRGYSLDDLGNAISDAPALLKYGFENPDAFMAAGVEGLTTMSAVSLNAAVNISTMGVVDKVITGKKIQAGVEGFVDWGFDQYDKRSKSDRGGGGGVW
jgi:RHS repeat-associated protein